MDSTKLKALLIVVIALFFALYLGIAAATAQTEVLSWIGGGLFLTLCLVLGRHIWILIPATLGMGGGLNFIPGSPAPWHFMTAVVAGFTLLRILARQQKLHIRWTGMETVILLVAFTILQAFLRNPTGVAIFGGDTFGGKPYFIYGVAFIAYFLISTAEADFKMWRWAVIAYAVIWGFDGLIYLTSAFVPQFAEIMIQFYSNVSYEAAHAVSYYADTQETRITQFAQIGACLGLIACSFWRPLGALDLTKPWRGLISLTGVAATVLSGFRSFAVNLICYFVMGSLIRRKPLDAIVVLLLGIMAVAVVVVTVPSSNLPYSVQRVLSVIPGYARADIAKNAKDSNEFRFEMWELALTTDRFIKNKLLGDGFQFSASEFAAREAMRLKDYRMTGGLKTVDMFMITGSYHGFHVETIRYTGIVGLIVATAALIVFAVFAHRCIKAYRNQSGWGHVIFICMPFLLYPLWYWLVFGDYKTEFAVTIAKVGLIRLLWTIHRKESTDSELHIATHSPAPPY